MRAPGPRKAQVVQMVQIRAVLQPENMPASGNIINAKRAPICTKRTRGPSRARVSDSPLTLEPGARVQIPAPALTTRGAVEDGSPFRARQPPYRFNQGVFNQGVFGNLRYVQAHPPRGFDDSRIQIQAS